MHSVWQRILRELETGERWAVLSAAFLRARRKLATAGVVLLTLWVAYHVVFGANGMMIYQQKKSDYRRLQKEVDALQKQNDDLSKQVNALRTDPKAIEKEAREQLRYAKPGEVIYLLPQKPAADQPSKNSAKK